MNDTTSTDKLNTLPEVIAFCKANNLPADVVGRWVWIRFKSKPSYETRELLKAAGFSWISRRGQWAHSCGTPSKKGKGDPRWKYSVASVHEFSDDEIRALRSAA
jgi:hypothetical protein